jgi:oxygenase catalysing oxidative methylation of damaged DNA
MYITQFGTKASNRTVKPHLAAIRQLLDYLSTGGILGVNPAASRGTYRVTLRHGVSRFRSGQRQTLGIIRDEQRSVARPSVTCAVACSARWQRGAVAEGAIVLP